MANPIVALAGGVGAARFLKGLLRVINPEDLTVIVNTGDDETFYGLRVCPDLDTITYNLSGIADESKGWGVGGDTFNALAALRYYGHDTWFGLGDRDLGTQLHRNELLRRGMSLSQVTGDIARTWGLKCQLLPMTDHRVETRFQTREGILAFQEYFVKRQALPTIQDILFEGANIAEPAPGVLEAIASAKGIIICPSNPLISIGPILAISSIRRALSESSAMIVSISPIIAGEAVKGPTKTMMQDMKIEASAYGVAGLYKDLADCFIIDQLDANLEGKIRQLGLEVIVGDTLMSTLDKSVNLAQISLRGMGVDRQ